MTANKSAALKRGIDLLRDPQLNKSTAFTEAEREALGLTGLLPAGVDDDENQVRRVLKQFGQKTTDLERYIGLSALLDTDETLFYKVVMSDPARFLRRRRCAAAVALRQGKSGKGGCDVGIVEETFRRSPAG